MITEDVLAQLRGCIGSESFKAYFARVEFQLDGDDAAFVLTPTRHAKESLETIYKREILAALRSVNAAVVTVRYVVAPSMKLNASAGSGGTNGSGGFVLPTLGSAAHANGNGNGNGNGSAKGIGKSKSSMAGETVPPLELPLSACNTLAKFENGLCNKIACSAAHTIVESPAIVFNPLCVHGAHGVGKTHILQGIALGILEREPGSKVLYTSGEAFANAYIAALQARTPDTFRARFRDCTLIVDEIDFLIGKIKTQEELLHIVQRLRGAGKQVVFASNVPLAGLVKMNPGLLEIIRSGLVLGMSAPEFELRVKLLHVLAARRNWVLDADAARVLATHVDQSVGALDGALCKTLALARACGVPANAELALSALSKLGHVRNGPLTLSDVLDAAAKFYKHSQDDVRSDKRAACLVHTRHMAMHLARHLTPHTTVEIGRFFGNRDHTSVLHAVRKINGLLKREDPIREEQRLIKQALGR